MGSWKAGGIPPEYGVMIADQQPEVWVYTRDGGPGSRQSTWAGRESDGSQSENPPDSWQSTCRPAQGIGALMWTGRLQNTSLYVKDRAAMGILLPG